MNSRELTTFIATAECNSFSKAEERLFLSKQAIRKQISTLEAELSTPLLLRTHSGVTLTEAGKVFYEDAQRILAEMNAAMAKCKAAYLNEPELRIATPAHPRLMLDDVFVEFSSRFPNVHLHLVMQPSSLSLKDVLNGTVDIAEYTYSEKLKNSEIGFVKTRKLPFKCLMEPNHPLAARKSIFIEDLSEKRIGVNVRDFALISQIEENCVNVSIEEFESYDMQRINNLCFNGGIFISKAYFIDFMRPLKTIPFKTDFVPQGVIIFRRVCSPVVKEFVKIVEEKFPQIEN